ncbi:4-hydroxythreonine-4-phosphate dehydrogenase PdxA [Neptunomonas marina]|uniref:4-hydroxythreonine-4-phosphate dehydrogenase n=1 Tax=Neptunomonas marina TaxID=1815562 RepID=A0A437Q743_9GAMM|nr:4-hydroxythreonine-4-phosphate dehydrogenase PdxA [Neptunomonas marina]RVU30345.1 4-hydroxythreonine-4-phosphate dehydrogenase PdxA [Neptunomonas marina]
MSQCKRIAITVGEPAGIGPDLVIMIAQQAYSDELIAICDPELLITRARQLNLPIAIERCTFDTEPTPHIPRTIKVYPVELKRPAVAGELNPDNAAYVVETLRIAAEESLAGRFDAIVTAPVHKGVINEGGIAFTGHTEYFEAITQTPQVVMMLATEGLRVALVTTHLPLSAVSAAITPERLTDVVTVLHTSLKQDFGIADPHILVAGLNPHAGESGHLGHEEQTTIEPTLATLRAQGLKLTGPLPADTLFTPKYLETCDAALTMYHDQGLPVLKYKGFGNAVNITLGMPIIRTSVDHGTALDLAGTGRADAGSLRLAIQYASDMARNKAKSIHERQETH